MNSRTSHWYLALVFPLAGCTGEIGGDAGSHASGPNGPGGLGGAASGGLGGAGGVLGPSTCGTAQIASPATRIVRLSHLQYDGAVQATLKLTTHPSAQFSSDVPVGGFDNNADALKVVDRMGRDYRRAAEEAAAALVADATKLGQVAPCATPDTTSCGTSFVQSFGRTMFRRALDAEETTRYVALYNSGPTLLEAGSTHARGVQVVVEAMLQSPLFLYRVELNDAVDASGASRLSGPELAARLSFAFWNMPPDASLLAAADTGLKTAADVRLQAERLLGDERARSMLEDFHRQWLGTDAYTNIARNPEDFPAFVAGIGESLKEEARRFVSSITFDRDLGLYALLNDNQAFVNADLAKVYGLTGTFGADFMAVQLEPTERAGLLTRAGFLAQNAHATSSAPILRGAQVLKRFLCYQFPPPPAGASTTPLPAFSDTVRTGRDQVTKLTESANCAGCHHSVINPMGFAFEAYDAVGQYRTQDRGFPVDLRGSFALGTTTMAFDGAIEASKKIAESEEARTCYATNLLRYAYARLNADADNCEIQDLAKGMSDATYGTKKLLADLAQSPSFQYRAAEVP
jgi:Protein of unknown function (DUF1592)/Protein of unknown function (DUF1588)/Protein of unknown function (DUF1595)/Protein of unknown function (DUF1585)/Protein of unknown function (DUF1587)